jgi:hypothetical protein
MKRLAAACAAIAALTCASPTRAATVEVTVTIDTVINWSVDDAWSQPPDFYARLWIGDAMFRTPTMWNLNSFVSPAGWTFKRQVSRASRGGGIVPVRIELFDYDHPFSDPIADIDPAPCMSSQPFPLGCADLPIGLPPVDSYGVDVDLNLFDGSWTPRSATGDSSAGPATPGVPQRGCTIGAGLGVANVCFTISVGAPTPEVLTVSKTSDSNRGFCAAGDCSLREAVALAENGDIIDLPAAATPYLLSVNEGVYGHLAISPGPDCAPRTVFIRGPRTGGTAVIRQTAAPFRVFDVHACTKLLLGHVTITGGGADKTSTAQPDHIHGGGIHNHGDIELSHVTITGNRATYSQLDGIGGGGGIYNAPGARAKLLNVTIAGNVSSPNENGIPLGGGIAGPGTYTLRNTLIANNTTDGSGAPSNCGLRTPLYIVDEGGNLQFPGNDCGRWYTRPGKFGTTLSFWWPYFATAAIDPLLPLDPSRWIYLPVPNGPPVDIGVTGITGCHPTDQAGQPAPRDGNFDGVAACDAGAIEAP